MADPKGKDKGLLAQVYELEIGNLKLIHGRAGECSSYEGCTPMEDSGAPGAVTDMERVCSFSVLDLDSGKVGSSAFTSSDVKEMHGEALLPFGVTRDMVVTSAITVMLSPVLKNGSQSHCRHQWVKYNCFSPLSKLGHDMGIEFREGED